MAQEVRRGALTMGRFAGKTVITFGSFDLFHIGHLNILRHAKGLGDRLVVGISTDRLNFEKKKKYPIIPEYERYEIVRSLACVDETFYEESLEFKGDYIKRYQADILVMGEDWKGRFDQFSDKCDVRYLPRTETISTTTLEKFIQVHRPKSPDSYLEWAKSESQRTEES